MSMGVVPLEVGVSGARNLMVWRYTEEWQCLDDTSDCFYRTNSDEQLRGEEDKESYAIQIRDLIEYHFWLYIEVSRVN